jgi:hypothetical protein
MVVLNGVKLAEGWCEMPAPLIGLAAKEALKKTGKFIAKRDPVALGALAMSPMLGSLAHEGGKKQGEINRQNEEKKKQKQYEEQDKQEGRGMKKGGKVSSASKRADGCAQRGKTRGKMV